MREIKEKLLKILKEEAINQGRYIPLEDVNIGLIDQCSDYINFRDSKHGQPFWNAIQGGEYDKLNEWNLIYDINEDDFKGDIKGFPKRAVEILLETQFRQYGTIDITVFENSLNSSYEDFNWWNCKEFSQEEMIDIMISRNFHLLNKNAEPIDPIEAYNIGTSFSFKNSEITGQISGVPRSIVSLMIDNQFIQTGKRDLSKFITASASRAEAGGFNWDESIEGNEYWINVDCGEYEEPLNFIDKYRKRKKVKFHKAKSQRGGKVKDYRGVYNPVKKSIKIRDFWMLKSEAVVMSDKTYEAPEFVFTYEMESYSMYDERFVFTRSDSYQLKENCVFIGDDNGWELRSKCVEVYSKYLSGEMENSSYVKSKYILKKDANSNNKYRIATIGEADGYAILKSDSVCCYDNDGYCLRSESHFSSRTREWYWDENNVPVPMTRAHIYSYHKSQPIIDMSDDSQLKVGFEIEKKTFGGKRRSEDKVAEFPIFKGLETDSSCGVEAITNILPLGLSGTDAESKTFSLMEEASQIIDEEDVDSNCGGHISISCRNMNAKELLLRMRGNLSIMYALFRYRLNNSYCEGNRRADPNRNAKYSPINIKSKYNSVEIRIPNRVLNVTQLKNRYRLVSIIADHSVNTEDDFDSLLDKVDPVLRDLYSHNPEFIPNIIDYAKHFRHFIMTGEAHESISDFVDNETYSEAPENTQFPIYNEYEETREEPEVVTNDTVREVINNMNGLVFPTRPDSGDPVEVECSSPDEVSIDW